MLVIVCVCVCVCAVTNKVSAKVSGKQSSKVVIGVRLPRHCLGQGIFSKYV